MKKRDVEHEVDLAELPPLSAADAELMKDLQHASDEEIDKTEIPLLSDAFWEAARPNPFYRPMKTSTTIRIDSDVLAWFKAQGKGYQSRINAALRRTMLADKQT